MIKRVFVAALALLAAASAADAAQTFLDANAIYPEAAQFVGDTLYVAELPSDRINIYQRGAKRVFFHEAGCGPASIRPFGDDLAIFCHISGELVIVDKTAAVRARIGKGVLRNPNDGAPDGKGGLYLSDPGLFSKDTRPNGLVYHLTSAGALVPVLRDLWYPNGIYVEKGQLFLSETFTRKVWRYAIGADGALRDKTLYVDIDKSAPRPKRYYREAGPDGLARAPNGEMVIAIYGEGRLVRVDRAGNFVGQIDTPFAYVDNVAFGAPGAVLMGAYDNINPPMRGAIVWWSR